MDKEVAIEGEKEALLAIEALNRLLLAAQGQSSAKFEAIQSAVGFSMIKIDTEILIPIYRKFPDLDHLKKGLFSAPDLSMSKTGPCSLQRLSTK